MSNFWGAYQNGGYLFDCGLQIPRLITAFYNIVENNKRCVEYSVDGFIENVIE
ncbi:MAG: hypothetical protein IJV68_01910 [Clostridia bacterium]|nr:hypothetical protein [Clostridia bacterium]